MEVLIASSVMGLVAVGMTALVSQYLMVKSVSDTHRTATLLRNLLLDNLNSQRGWRKTISASVNTSMTCLRDHQPCPNVNDAPITIFDGSSFMVYDSQPPNNGFGPTGRLCQTFNPNPGQGDDNCPYRFSVTWTSICPASGTCQNPEIQIKGRFLYNPEKRNAGFNPQRYDFNFVRDIEVNTFWSACLSLGGRYDPTTQECIMPYGDSDCPAGTYLIGLTADTTTLNQKVCRSFIGSCPTDQIMIGINPDGSPSCAPACSAAPPPIISVVVPPGPGGDGGGGDGGGGGGSDGGCGG
jgi:hypothetical protein